MYSCVTLDLMQAEPQSEPALTRCQHGIIELLTIVL